MKEKLKIFRNIVLSGLVALCGLSVFCFFYDYDGAAVPDPSLSTNAKRHPYQLEGYMREGYSLKRTDKNGYYNLPDAVDQNPFALLMGSSHMEAKQMQTENSAGALLNQRYPTYNIGVAEHGLELCVKHAENAAAHYAPTNYLILETTDCYLNTQEMKDALYGENQLYTQGTLSSGVIQYIPAASVLANSLNEWLNVSPLDFNLSQLPGEAVTEPAQLDPEYLELLEPFLQKAAAAVEGRNLKMIIFRMHAFGVDARGLPLEDSTQEQEAMRLFSELCKKYGIEFVDMRPHFEKLYEEERVLPFGFSNTILGGGHLNKNGHRVVAQVLGDTMERLEQEKLG